MNTYKRHRFPPDIISYAVWLYYFPQLVFSYAIGIDDELLPAQIPGVRGWLGRVLEYMPENPLLAPDYMIVNPVSQMFETSTEHSAQTA